MRIVGAALLLAALAGSQTTPAVWRPLFDGKSLGSWRGTQFRGAGKVSVSDGVLALGAGGPLTGVTWAGEFPRNNFEIRFEGRRVQGGDFFASITFPYGGSHCTWVLGGWGGDIIGLSSIDGWDASDNETRTYFNFENGRWYALRLRVTPERITTWIDDREVVNVEIAGRKVSLRPGEIERSAPLGFASYNTAGELRKIEYRTLP